MMEYVEDAPNELTLLHYSTPDDVDAFRVTIIDTCKVRLAECRTPRRSWA